jgi:hypothetical protein
VLVELSDDPDVLAAGEFGLIRARNTVSAPVCGPLSIATSVCTHRPAFGFPGSGAAVRI